MGWSKATHMKSPEGPYWGNEKKKSTFDKNGKPDLGHRRKGQGKRESRATSRGCWIGAAVRAFLLRGKRENGAPVTGKIIIQDDFDGGRREERRKKILYFKELTMPVEFDGFGKLGRTGKHPSS